LRQLLADPAHGDNYFVVQEATNGPAPKHFVALDDALSIYTDKSETDNLTEA
jgi:hypothetical protein